jgi:hypothetical protein
MKIGEIMSLQLRLLLIAFFTLMCSQVLGAKKIPPTHSEVEAGFKQVHTPVWLFKNSAWIGTVQTTLNASADTKAKANELAGLLAKMTGQAIAITSGVPGPGIRIGTLEELKTEPNVKPLITKFKDDYILITKNKAVTIVGKDQGTLDLGMWRFFEILGYRQFFPGPTWEYIPQLSTLYVDIAIGEVRKFQFLNFVARGCGTMPYNFERTEDWNRKNRATSAVSFTSGHAWGQIVGANKSEFDAHPEYVSTSGNKLCVLEPKVQEMAVTWAKNFFKTRPDSMGVSMAIADNTTGWDEDCENTHEQSQYTPSDRQVLLANHVQEQLALDPLYVNKRVTIQAYGEASFPPNIRLDPRLITVVPDGYIFGGQTLDEVYAGYRARGATVIGPYDYLLVFGWDHDTPGLSKLSDPNFWPAGVGDVISRGDPNFLFYSAEGSDSWGTGGVGYYVMARLMTSPTNENLEQQARDFKQDFLNKAFGPVVEPMAQFFDVTDKDPFSPALSTDLIHKMYANLKWALDLGPDEGIKKRIQDLVLYTRYVELYRNFVITPNDASNVADVFDEMMKHAYRIRETQMVHYRCMFYAASFMPQIEALQVKYGMSNLSPYTATDNNPWPGGAYTDSEIEEIIGNGLANNPVLPFTPRAYDNDLVKPSTFDEDTRGRSPYTYLIKNQTWYLQLAEGLSAFDFTAQGGRAYDFKGPSTFNFYNESDGSLAGTVVVPEDNVARDYSVPLLAKNLYRIEILDKAGVYFNWDRYKYAVVKPNSEADPFGFYGSYGGYFYVPKGTVSIGGYWKYMNSQLIDPNGQIVLTPSGPNSYFNFVVPPGLDGKVWQFDQCNGECRLLTVPPFTARSPQELLLPKEVVEQDQLGGPGGISGNVAVRKPARNPRTVTNEN